LSNLAYGIVSFLRHDDGSGSWLPTVCVRKTKGPSTMWVLASSVSSNSNDVHIHIINRQKLTKKVGLDRNTVAWTDADADQKFLHHH